MPWYDWVPDGSAFASIPRRQASGSTRLLTRQFRRAFIGQEGAIRTTHPLLKEWDTVGGNAFLQLNGLADDIRLLRGKLGLETVLTDIRDERLCLPSWHLLHTAALFERAQARSVVEFLEGGEEERPDAIVEVGGVRIPLEAKLLTRSEDEEHFLPGSTSYRRRRYRHLFAAQAVNCSIHRT